MASPPKEPTNVTAGPPGEAAPVSSDGDAAATPDATQTIGDRIRPIVAEIRERVADLANRELALRQREEEVEQQYRLLRLEARETAHREWREAQERLQERSNELDAQSAELTARAARLDELERRLAGRQAEHERVQRQVTEQLRRLRQQMELLNRERERERERLRQRISLVRQREQRTGLSSADTSTDPARPPPQLEARPGPTPQRPAETPRWRRLEDYDQQLRGRAAALEAEARRLAAFEKAVAEQRAAAESLVQRAEERLREVDRRRAELVALREQVDSRQGEVRQTQLALELEQQEVLRQQRELARGQEDLLTHRRQREAELADARAALSVQAEQLRRTLRSRWVTPRHVWLRSTAMAVLVGIFAALGWLGWDRPGFRASCELTVAEGAAAPGAALWEHERRLRTAEVLDQVLPEASARRAWELVRIDPIATARGPALRLSVDGSDPEALRRLIEDASSAYRKLAETWPAGALASPDAGRLFDDRERLGRELERQQAERRGMESELAMLVPGEQRDARRREAARLRTEYDEVVQTLAEQRQRLNTLMAEAAPRGTVTGAELETALVADDMYAEDLKELRATGSQYRSELAVAMLLVVDPAREVQRVLTGWATTLREQRELQPPLSVVTVLEQIDNDAAAFAQTLAGFLPQWTGRLDALKAMLAEQQLPELIRQQQAAADDGQKLVSDAAALVAGLRARLDSLSQDSENNTRAVVVAAVLRDGLARFTAAIKPLADAAEQCDLSKNVRLDALDRQLRGLHARLDRRQAGVRQQLQFEADERARREHVAQIAHLQQQVGGTESRRERLVAGLSDLLEELRRLDGEIARRKELEGALRLCDARSAELQRQIAAIHEQLQTDAQEESAAAALAFSPVEVRMVAGTHRQRNAVLVAVAAGIATMAVSLLMVVRNPLRREGWERALARLEPTAESAPVQVGRTEADRTGT